VTELALHPARVVRRPLHPEDQAKFAERARILTSASAEALIAIEHTDPDVTGLIDELDRLLPRLAALADRLEQGPQLPF
jgi:hypothetical protein